MTDAGLLARATVWAATNPQCANQAFNITNGDLFRWNEMWPKIARFFEMETAAPLPMSLNVVMADKAALWSKMKEKYALADHPYEAVSSWGFGDAVFSWNYDFFADGTKARRLGFHDYVQHPTLRHPRPCGGDPATRRLSGQKTLSAQGLELAGFL
jgi:nucleoside-diphosphate-sugar epimerase